MKRTHLLCLTALIFVINAKAQTLIAVQNGGTPRFYSILQDALTAAQNRDTIYIPGGSYSLINGLITIDKELHLIGTGHNQDSTAVGITKLNASILLITGSNNSSFEGVFLNGAFLAYDDYDVDNIVISRCNCGDIRLSKSSSNWTVSENVINGSLYGSGTNTGISEKWAKGNFFSNNIISVNCSYFGANNTFANNIFLNIGNTPISYHDGSLFENNIIINDFLYSLSSCMFYNNLLNPNTRFESSCIVSNNKYFAGTSSIFVNQSGTAFDYKQDYHLKPDSPGRNAGKDGTDIGIYGGTFPWKDGAIPSNPHYQSVQISGKTDNSGKLNVKIKVAAQDN